MRACLVCLPLVPLLTVLAPAAPPGAAGVAFSEKKVRRWPVEPCSSCHSAQAKKQRGGLALDTKEAVLKGGDRGPAVVPGKPDESLSIRAVRHVDKAVQMPPKRKLPASAVADLTEWVRMGAPDPRVGDIAPPS